MENLLFIGIAFLVGIGIGYFAGMKGGQSSAAEAAPAAAPAAPEKNWWKLRETLTGTQAQILQHMDETGAATITELQEKFSFIPDRELYYRMEQIALMGFLDRERKEGDMHYSLNEQYAQTVEGDKTVMLSS